MKKQLLNYFLGANSCEGFISHFGDCFLKDGSWHAVIIKGGPGTGKSSFMKYIANTAQKKGMTTELCPCSSDPDSLDAVIIKEKKLVFLDGTSPHIVEPIYPGVCEEIINLGDMWDFRVLAKNVSAIIEATDRNKLLHRRTSGYLSAAGQLLRDNLRIAKGCCDAPKAEEFARRLCRRLIPCDKSGRGAEQRRFIQGVTPRGIVTFDNTVMKLCENRLIIDDKYGAVSDIIVRTAREYALASGYDIITLENPLLPNELIDHILIPELSLCFVRENPYIHFECDNRRIHARRFTDMAKLNGHRSRMLFNRRVADQLLLTACETLSSAKNCHDELEAYYIKAMDFKKVTELAEATADRLLG